MALTGTVKTERDGKTYVGYWRVDKGLITIETANGGYEKAVAYGASNYDALALRMLAAIISRGEA